MQEEKIKEYLIKKYGEKSIHPGRKTKIIKLGFIYVVDVLANYDVMSIQPLYKILAEAGKKYNKNHVQINNAIRLYTKDLTTLSAEGFILYTYMDLLKKGIIKR